MTTTRDQEEQDLRIELMQSDIANKAADTGLKQQQRQWEPWKFFASAVVAAAALLGAGATIGSYFTAHNTDPLHPSVTPIPTSPPIQQLILPPGTVITIPPAKP